MIKILSAAAVALTILLAGCDSLRDAMSTHPSVVAKAAGAELSVTELAALIGNSQAPLRKDVAQAVTDAWVNYQLVGKAAANSDSLRDPKLIDKAMWAPIANVKASKWYQLVSKSWRAPDSSEAEGFYNNGRVLAANHILLLTQGLPDSAKATARKRIDALRAQASPANFADLARRNSQDPGSKDKGGSLGTFARGAMVAPFEQALLALKPGEISPVVETQYGYHIIRRPLYSEVRPEVVQASQSVGLQAAESTYLATLEQTADLKMKPGIAPTVRAVVDDPEAHKTDKTVLATSDIGEFRASDLSRWMTTIPPQAGIQQRVKSAPDSAIPNFVKNFIRNELVVHAADSAKLGPDSTEMAQIRTSFANALRGAWTALGVSPKDLAAAKSKSDREKLANQRAQAYIRNLMTQKAQYVDVTEPVQSALREKYGYDINSEAMGRALIEASQIRLKADSAKAAGQPPTAVPLPKQDTTTR
ncbi:MAG TPA: peptidylprolyl isomerase [Gemmatimonadaceae bacterium]|nr:peptidylprolyl isomerase [Gemmatimonadaceae bacterium]